MNDSTKSKCVATIFRVTSDSEVTKTDGSLTRVEVGTTMTMKYWDNKNQIISASFKLQGAYSALLASSGFAASALALLSMALF